MRLLFKNISNNKKEFNFEDFRLLYEKKPLLLSWIDYFKKDEAEMIPNIDESIKELLTIQYRFFHKFGNILEETIKLDENNFNFSSLINVIQEFCNIFEKQKIKIEKFSSRINIRKIFGKLKNFNVNIPDLQYQKNAKKENAYIETFHKNHLANLINICEECHQKIHKTNN